MCKGILQVLEILYIISFEREQAKRRFVSSWKMLHAYPYDFVILNRSTHVSRSVLLHTVLRRQKLSLRPELLKLLPSLLLQPR